MPVRRIDRTKRLVVAGNNCYFDAQGDRIWLAELDRDMLAQFADAWMGPVTVLGLSPRTDRSRDCLLGSGRVVLLARPAFSSGYWRILALPLILWRMFREIRKADVVYARLPSPMGFWALVIASITKRQAFVSLHGVARRTLSTGGMRSRLMGALAIFVYSRLMQKVDAAFSTSREVAQRYGVKDGEALLYRSSVVRDVVDAPVAKSFPGRPLRLCFVGRFTAEKDPLLFVEVIANLLSRDVLVEGAMVGEGALKRDLEIGVSEKGLPVTIRGWLDRRSDVAEFLGGQDLVLVTSPVEGSPKILVEGMAVGTPGLIAARNSTIDEYVRQGSVWAVADHSPASWALAVEEACAPEVYCGLASKGLEIAKDLTLAAVAARVAEFLDTDGT